MSLIDRLTAIAKRDLDDRTISPGEAHDLLDVVEAARAVVDAGRWDEGFPGDPVDRLEQALRAFGPKVDE